MRIISLFAGIGGFDIAFEQAGHTVVAQVESDPQCRAVLAEHWPHVARFDDVRTFHAQRGEADIVVGGFPCQDLSIAGKRAGFTGKRSSLFFEMVRIIHECRPAYVVWENVPGLLSSNNGRDFASVLVALGNIGYHGAWTMLDAQFFGCAQRRRRVFGVFACGDSGAGRCAEILSFAARLHGHSQSSGEAGKTVAYALAAGAGGSKFGSGRQGQDTLIAGAWIAGSKNTDENSAQSGHLIAGSLQAHSKRHGHAMTTQQAAESNQLIVGVHPSGVRRLTPTECERLQGFPDGWTASQSDSARYRMLGNAVAVPVVKWIAHRIAKVQP